jgi:hypothetical protein
VIEVQALGLSRADLELLLIPVAIDGEAPTRLDGLEDGDEPVLDPVTLRDLFGNFLLAHPTRREVQDGSFPGVGFATSSLFQPSSHPLGKVREVLEEDLLVPKEALEPCGVGDAAKGASEDEPVETGQNSDDFLSMAL